MVYVCVCVCVCAYLSESLVGRGLGWFAEVTAERLQALHPVLSETHRETERENGETGQL